MKTIVAGRFKTFEQAETAVRHLVAEAFTAKTRVRSSSIRRVSTRSLPLAAINTPMPTPAPRGRVPSRARWRVALQDWPQQSRYPASMSRSCLA